MRPILRNVSALGSIAVVAIAAVVAFGIGVVPRQIAKLTSSDVARGDFFGSTTAIDGDTIVVGAYYKNLLRGAAYVFRRTGTTWKQEAKLAGAADQRDFGVSVAIDGDTAVVGAYKTNGERGAVYVFTRSGTKWTEQATLADPGATPSDHFGASVAISGDTAVVGAFGSDDYRGAAYVFTRSGSQWTQQAKLTAADPGYDGVFGDSVAISGDTVVVGAYWSEYEQGGAFVFTRTGTVWTLEAELSPDDAYDEFGDAVAISGDTVVAASYSSDAAYVYTRSGTTWMQQATLVNPGSNGVVAVAGDMAVVGTGLFARSGATWQRVATFAQADPGDDDGFAAAVALSADTAVVGADRTNGYRGAAYVFDLAPDVEPSAGCLLPTKAKAKANLKRPEKSTFAVTGTLDTGSGTPDFAGPAAFDVGGFHLDVPAFVAKGRTLRYAADGITLTITPAKNGSSHAVFGVSVVGDLAGKVALEGPLPLRFANAVHQPSCVVYLKAGALAPHGVAEPALAVRSAAATLKGPGKDTLSLTLSFATDGTAPAAAQDLTVSFGDTYASPVLPAASFVRRRDAYVHVAKAPGITKATVDYAKGTITVAGSRLDLGAFRQGGNAAVVTITLGGASQSARVRMMRTGAKLAY